MKKYWKLFITLLFSLIVLPLSVNAASASIGVSGTSNAIVGNKVTVTVTLSSKTSIGSWQMNLNYDKNYLSLTSSSAEAGGTVMASSSATGVKSKSYTFTFKALKSGSTTVSVGSYLAYAFDDLSEMSLSSGSKTIKIMTQAELESTYSTNNNLKGLTIDGYTLTPEFSKDVTDYTVDVPEDTKQVIIKATKDDVNESITGDGTINVTLGVNAIKIVVQAQSGAEKTYTITVNVKDSNPININVNNIDYTLVKLKDNLPEVTGYTEKDITINEQSVPALYSDVTKLTLVALKDKDGNIKLFIYDNDKYTLYQEIKFNELTIYPLETNLELSGYHKTNITINEIEIPAYVYKDDSNFAVIYGENTQNGDIGFYLYDKKNNSVTKYNDEYILDLENKNKLYFYLLIAFSVILLIFVIVLIKLLNKKNKHNKKEIKENNQDKENEIVEI
jgi:hypothetical protein